MSQPQLLLPDNETTQLFNAIDWQQHPMSAPSEWDCSITAIFQLMANSLQPMSLFIGEQYFYFYNDGIIPLIGREKHPRSYGLPGKQGLYDVWHYFGHQVEAAFKSGDRFMNSNVMVPKVVDGEFMESFFTFSYTPVLSADGNICGVFCAAHETTSDVFALKNAEFQSQQKSDLLADVSHELRTPLKAMLGYVKLMQSDELSAEERTHFLEIILSSGEELQQIIDDLLDLSKIEAGRLQLETLKVPCQSVFQDLYETLRLQAHQKGLQLRYSLDESVPQYIGTDPLRLKQVLMNLVANAIKFTDAGSVDVQARYTSESESRLVVDIQDTGIGISEEQRQRLFKPYSQADVSHARKFGGTGLGLELSMRLCRELGGTLELVSSEVGVGSHFRVQVRDRISELLEPADA